MRARRRSSGSSFVVAITPPSSAASRWPRASTTPKPVLADPGSIPSTITTRVILLSAPDASRAVGRPGRRRELSDALEDRSLDIEVGVHRGHVVVVLERLDQAHERAGVRLVDLDTARGPHRQLGRLDLDPGLLQRGPHARELRRLGDDLVHALVADDILGAGVDRRHEVLLAVAL